MLAFWPGQTHRIYNNIFYNEDGANNFDWSRATEDGEFTNNVFYGFTSTPGEGVEITADPKLVNPGSGGIGLTSVDSYKLQADSPAIGAGIEKITGTRPEPANALVNEDFFGNSLYLGYPEIGVQEILDDITEYSLTVENGITSGNYATGDIITDTTSESTTATMPDYAATVTANYTTNPEFYTLTVINGLGSGEYSLNETPDVEADAAPADMIFEK